MDTTLSKFIAEHIPLNDGNDRVAQFYKDSGITKEEFLVTAEGSSMILGLMGISGEHDVLVLLQTAWKAGFEVGFRYGMHKANEVAAQKENDG